MNTNAWDDRASISEVLGRYAVYVDERNFGRLRECFTQDARATFSGTELAPGIDAILEHVSRVARFDATHHIIGVGSIDIKGETANSNTPAVAYLFVDSGGGNGRLTIRGLRYRDRLVRTELGWRIADRLHEVTWSTVVPADDLRMVAGASPTP